MSALEIFNLPLENIEVSDRLRAVDEREVKKLAASMQIGKQRRLIQPITVRRLNGDRYRLVTGAHRYEAARALGWKEIASIVEEKMTEDEARIREIDENLHRAELTPYDQAEFLTMRWRLWLRRKDQRSDLPKVLDLVEDPENVNFFEEVAGLAGLNPETIRLAVRRRRQLENVWTELKFTDAAKKGVLLDRLRKRPEQIDAVMAAAAQNGGSIQEALEAQKFKKIIPKLSAKQSLKNLKKAWKVCPVAQREEFIEWLREQGEV